VTAAPAIQYVQTSDGVRIAYYSAGSGFPVVVLHPNPTSHLTLEWNVPAFRGFYERLLRKGRLIRLDYRGSGLSERGVTDLSLDNLQTDIRTVVDRLGLERFAFFTWGFGSALALRFVVEQPERVERLVLAEATAMMADASLNLTVASLRDVDAEVQLRTRANLMTGWSDPENADALAALIRGGMNLETFHLWRSLIRSARNAPSMSPVNKPALLVHAQDDPLFPLAGAQALAAALPNAVMRVIPGAASITPFTEPDAVEAALAFLFDEEVSNASAYPSAPNLLSTREAEVLRLIAAGKTNAEIARELFISASTVSHHVSNILAKTNVGNRTEAAAFAHREGLT